MDQHHIKLEQPRYHMEHSLYFENKNAILNLGMKFNMGS